MKIPIRDTLCTQSRDTTFKVVINKDGFFYWLILKELIETNGMSYSRTPVYRTLKEIRNWFDIVGFVMSENLSRQIKSEGNEELFDVAGARYIPCSI